jgi:acetylornithine deacetylase/succinyl-diaminopimelate desuccinylase-like protein
VIPKVAVGKISLRFVPEQDHQTLIECLQQHIEKRFKLLWSANRVELQVCGLHSSLVIGFSYLID